MDLPPWQKNLSPIKKNRYTDTGGSPESVKIEIMMPRPVSTGNS